MSQPLARRAGLAGLALTALALGALLQAAGDAPARAQPDDKAAALFESSFAHEATGETDRALNDVLAIVRADDRSYVATLRAAWLYYLKGSYGDSVRFYTLAGKLAPAALEPQLGLMLPLMAAGRWGEAEAIARKVLKAAPRNYLATSRLAFIQWSQGAYPEAERLYRQVLADWPSDTEMMLGLGWTYVKMGRSAEARAMFEQVLTIHRSNLNARAGLEAL